ncbi:MAG: histidine phosphatase family protein [Desulfobacterales bacterium]|nr:histidine phosphatase family protein [Desulfobacterales bacterium]
MNETLSRQNTKTMHKPRTIYLVRHGENPANLKRELSCKLIDYPLTAKGRWQAMRTAEFFLTKDIVSIYSSPLRRAAETARIIADVLQQNFVLLDEFRELDVGMLENEPASHDNWRIHDEILENWKNGDQSRNFPGGESYSTAVNRMKSGIRRVIRETSTIDAVVIAHGGIVNTTIASICQLPADSELRDFENCSVVTLIFDSQNPGAWGHVKDWAYTGHLSQCEEATISFKGDT